MPKYVCVSTATPISVPLGTVLIGTPVEDGRFVLTQDSDLLDIVDKPRWERGWDMPLVGNYWEWEEVKNHVL